MISTTLDSRNAVSRAALLAVVMAVLVLSGCTGNGSDGPNGRANETVAEVLAAYDLRLPGCAQQAVSFWDSPDNLNRSLVYRARVDPPCLAQILPVVGLARDDLLPYSQLPWWTDSEREDVPSGEISGDTTIVPATATRKEMQVDFYLVESNPLLLVLRAIYP
ncbi:hypothetical protein AB0J68_06590 [Micromonospora sp. NPDC049580]|uniref:hypothetical protein n=1 Tax=Micromonospora sp. NPDC049580 TaxID=3154832 RepID=UPI003436E0D8